MAGTTGQCRDAAISWAATYLHDMAVAIVALPWKIGGDMAVDASRMLEDRRKPHE